MLPGDRIRPARAEDTETLVSLWIRLVEHHRGLGGGFPALARLEPLLRREIGRGIRGGSCHILIAESEGRACGFLFAEFEAERGNPVTAPSTAWIHELYVSEEARGRGMGRALVASAERFLETQGRTGATVRVESGNRDALGFWHHLGFVERARILERPGGDRGLGVGDRADREGHAGPTATRPRD